MFNLMYFFFSGDKDKLRYMIFGENINDIRVDE